MKELMIEYGRRKNKMIFYEFRKQTERTEATKRMSYGEAFINCGPSRRICINQRFIRTLRSKHYVLAILCLLNKSFTLYPNI